MSCPAAFLEEAIEDNIAWCDAMLRAHGATPRLDARRWRCDGFAPPFYPNLITRRRGARVDEDIRELLPTLPPGWGIKDSFAELALEGRGFERIVEARWYARPVPARRAEASCRATASAVAGDAAALARWCAARRRIAGDGADAFPPSLLAREEIAFHQLERDGRIVAGLVATRRTRVSGVSNLFGAVPDLQRCLAALAARGRPLVGYGDAEELAALEPLGFVPLGRLCVWIATPPAAFPV